MNDLPRGLGVIELPAEKHAADTSANCGGKWEFPMKAYICLLYTSDAADEERLV